jgi:hypothetical protein
VSDMRQPDEPVSSTQQDAGSSWTFDEPLDRVLDISTWRGGTDLQNLYERIDLDRKISQAIAHENLATAAIRDTFRKEISNRQRTGAPPYAGWWQVPLSELEKVHSATLFAGHVDACSSTVQAHESLILSIIQIGIAMVGYRGDEGTWSHRLYRRDLQTLPDNAIEQARQLLDIREDRQAQGKEDGRTGMTELGRRGIRAYAERAVLTRHSQAEWRMGSGHPTPYELLTGAGAMDLVVPSIEMLEELLLGHRRFVFVHPRGDRGLLTIGRALAPLEFAVVHKLRRYIKDIVDEGHLRGSRRARAMDFVAKAGEEVCVGVLRASSHALPYVFYAPAEPELCAQAASIALADAVMQEYRGYPMLLDMAQQFCSSAFGREEFLGPIQAAYAAGGEPLPDQSSEV